MAILTDQTAHFYEELPKHITSIQVREQVPPWYQTERSSPEPNRTNATRNPESQQEDVKRLTEAGLDCYNNGKLEEAAECYRKALELHPDSIVALYTLGVASGQLKRYEESKEAFERLLRLLEGLGSVVGGSTLATAHQGIGAALLGLWVTEPQEPPFELASEGEIEFRRAVALDPNYFLGWVGLGLALHILERLDEAEAAFRKALEIDPDSNVAKERLRGVLRAFMQKAKGIWKDRHDLPLLEHLRRDWNRF